MVAGDKPSVMGILNATPEFLPMEVAVAEEVIDAFLEDVSGSGYEAYVAHEGADIKGYVCFGQTPLTESTWDIYWIAVSREAQGQGLGRALMFFAEEFIGSRRGGLIIVETSSKPSYDRTRRFYAALNYNQVCSIPDFYAASDDKAVYVKRIGDPRPHANSAG